MKCPHCLTAFHEHDTCRPIEEDKDGYWSLTWRTCPECHRLIISLGCGTGSLPTRPEKDFLVWPRAPMRNPVPLEVKDQSPEIAEDYTEACLVLADSPKASAALSRRCLQNLLREKAGVTPGKLSDEIQEVIDGGSIPSHITNSIDAVRVIGNFAAHPTKSKGTGDIVPVEPGEAEWNLDVLELLFDFYYVQPEVVKKKRAAVNKKLKDAGKPELK